MYMRSNRFIFCNHLLGHFVCAAILYHTEAAQNVVDNDRSLNARVSSTIINIRFLQDV